MYYYAELNDNDICVGVFESTTVQTGDNLIQIDSLNENLIGLHYNRTTGSWETPEFSDLAAHSTDEINYRETNQKLSDVLDAKAAASHTHAGYAAASHGHTVNEVSGLTQALAQKSDTGHTHSEYSRTGHTHTQYAATEHGHTVSDVEGLQSALDGKAAASHSHTQYAPTEHGHDIGDVSGLQTALDGKAADDGVVHLTGDEVIAGTKRFSSTMFAQHSIDDCTTVPTANQYQTALILCDNQGQAFGHLQTASYADTGSVLVKLSIVDGIRRGDAAATHAIGIGMDANGKHFTQAPTPDAGDDSNQIATTKWVNQKTADCVSTTGGTMTGNIVMDGSANLLGADRDLWLSHLPGNTAYRSVMQGGDAYATGASVYLNGKDWGTDPGCFTVRAHNGTKTVALIGKPDGSLTWGGQVYATKFNTTSDARLKSDLVPIEGALDKLDAIAGYLYTLKDTEGRSAGVIAQEVEKVLPEAVTTAEDGFKAVDYGAIVALLVAAVKELKAAG